MDSIVSRFLSIAEKYPSLPAIRFADKTTRKWEQITYRDLKHSVLQVFEAISTLSLAQQSRVVTWLNQSDKLIAIDLGCLAANCVVVPFVRFHSVDFVFERIIETEAKLVFVSSAFAATQLCQRLPQNWDGYIIVVQDDCIPSQEKVLSFSQFIKHGQKQSTFPSLFHRNLALILFTSGSTGNPKGVMLSHQNVLSNLENAFERTKPLPIHASFLSCLPVSSALERIAGYYAPLLHGCRIIINQSPFRLLSDIQDTHPHTMIVAPRLLRKIYTALLPLVQKIGREFQVSEEQLIQFGWEQYRQKTWFKRPSNLSNALQCIQHEVRKIIGPNFLYFVLGGAPLSLPLAHFFCALNIPVLQGYGLTEGCPCITGNSFLDNDPYTVGKPFSQTQVRISSDQEIQIQGPSVMKGYWNNPNATQQSFTDDGWLCTQDLGEFTPEGNLRIFGRKENTIVLSNGLKVVPEPIEQRIERHPFIEHALIVGNHQPFLIALVHFLPEKWRLWLEKHNIASHDVTLRFVRIQQFLLKEIRTSLKNYPIPLQPQKVIISQQKWTIENGYLTAHGKVNRKKILTDLMPSILSLYQNIKK